MRHRIELRAFHCLIAVMEGMGRKAAKVEKGLRDDRQRKAWK